MLNTVQNISVKNPLWLDLTSYDCLDWQMNTSVFIPVPLRDACFVHVFYELDEHIDTHVT